MYLRAWAKANSFEMADCCHSQNMQRPEFARKNSDVKAATAHQTVCMPLDGAFAHFWEGVNKLVPSPHPSSTGGLETTEIDTLE